MKISTSKRSVNDDKLSRRFELVSNLRSVSNKAHKSQRRYRIGLADDLFVGHRCSTAKRSVETPNKSPDTGSGIDSEPTTRTGFSKTDLAVGLAAVAGLTLGYLIGRRRK